MLYVKSIGKVFKLINVQEYKWAIEFVSET